MRKLLLLIPLLCGMAHADDGKVLTQLMLEKLADIPGKEALMLTVSYPPGGEDAIQRHDAHAFVYVLEGFGGDAAVTRQVVCTPPVATKTTGVSSSRRL